MALRLTAPPGVSDSQNFRARENYDRAIEQLLSLVKTQTVDVGSINAGAVASFTLTVPGARADAGMTVQVGLPAAWTVGLVPYGYVSADDTVTVVLYNSTGAPIDPASLSYSCRVMP